jgi:bacterioferritin
MVDAERHQHEPVVEALNGLIATELVAVNQYFLHAKILESRGLARLAKHFRDDSMDEMRDLEALMERVLYLGGLPNLQYLEAFQVGESVTEQLQLAQALESSAVSQLKAAVATCLSAGDEGSAELLRPMVPSEEEQLDWIRIQLELIASLGEANYLAQQLYP